MKKDIQRLAVTWEHPTLLVRSTIGTLEFDGSTSRFQYADDVTTVEGFWPLIGFPDINRTYETEGLFPLFARRVMSAKRPDYRAYLERVGLSGTPTEWEQLIASRGAVGSDSLLLEEAAA